MSSAGLPYTANFIDRIHPDSPTARIDELSFRRHPPAYPISSVMMGEEGQVVFAAICDEHGRVFDAKILTSSSHDRLDEAIQRAAQSQHWQCWPVSDKDGLHERWAKMVYRFQLSSAKNTAPHTASPQRAPRP
ncbi:TonB family protein [Nitrospirillum sp. BR 11163]|uniref:TonB family protein n=1 Tax=Nitrospirillum sp. BR 11163 TaxID=3104323 RepID=UPI003A4C7099